MSHKKVFLLSHALETSTWDVCLVSCYPSSSNFRLVKIFHGCHLLIKKNLIFWLSSFPKQICNVLHKLWKWGLYLKICSHKPQHSANKIEWNLVYDSWAVYSSRCCSSEKFYLLTNIFDVYEAIYVRMSFRKTHQVTHLINCQSEMDRLWRVHLYLRVSKYVILVFLIFIISFT